jgi:GDP-L-fucose synthase
VAGRDELDLRNQAAVDAWMSDRRPDALFLAAAKVGGILANSRLPVDFLYDNTMIAANLIHAAHAHGVERLLFLGSSCIYPKFAAQPMREEELLSGALEPTNQWYAIAKIAGLKLVEAYREQYGASYISAMPTNLYGPGDNFNLETSHVVPALIRKADDARRSGAKEFTVWGSGRPRREFLYVDDCAEACVFLMKHYDGNSHVNIGTGEDVTIAELAGLVGQAVGFQGSVTFDPSLPDGTPRKLLDVSRIHELGWTHRTQLEEGLGLAYDWYRAHGDQRAAVAAE